MKTASGSPHWCGRWLMLLSLCLMGFAVAPAASAQQTSIYQRLKSFGQPTIGGNPFAGLIQGVDGALYGTAYDGGRGYGTVFKVNIEGSGFIVLHYFDYSRSGASPRVGLVQGADGTLYGTAEQGGVSGYGTVFKLNPDGTGFTVLTNFDPFTTGGYPSSGLIQATDGALYGTTLYGASNSSGSVFKLNPDGSGFTVLKNFDRFTTGGRLNGLIQGGDGALYGTASEGGSSGGGTVFKLNPDGSGFTVLQNFDNSTTGAFPSDELMQGANGTLYGTATNGGSGGGGTVFKLNPDGTGFTILRNFGLHATGRNPSGRLVLGAADGALYGTTGLGGSSDRGTIFKLNSDGSGFTVLINFDSSTTGASPYGGLMQGTDGALYGTAFSGGSEFGGTVFKLDPDGSSFTVLKNLRSDPSIDDGGYLYAGLIQGADGALYGTAGAGGSYGAGTVFKLNPDGSGFTVLKDFDNSTTGGHPHAGLMQGTDGALYGTAVGGGSGGGGTVFKLDPDGSGFTVLKNLDHSTATSVSTTGEAPYAKLVQGTDGALYGTTNQGGSGLNGYEINGYGTVFKLNPDGSGFTVLLNFDWHTTGINPTAGLIQGTDGTLYGTTYEGGNGSSQGTVFRLNSDGTGFGILKSFDFSTDGGSPSGLIQGTDGALYGAAGGGGEGGSGFTGGHGTAFKLNSDGTGFTVLLHFDSATTGAYPLAALLQCADGALYGTTWRGGDTDAGTVFRLTLPITLTPSAVPSGSGAFNLTVDGCFFADGMVVQWNGADLETAFVSGSKLTASVPGAFTATISDISTALITIKAPGGTISPPEVFVVTAANVAEVQSDVAGAAGTVSVSTAPIGTGNTAGNSATLANSGDPNPVTITVAVYSSNPSPSTAFEIDSATGVAGEFLDLQVTGADAADTVNAYFYYPTDAVESETSPTLKYYDGSAWVDVFSSGGSAPGKNTAENLEGTISGGRFSVLFDNTSTPKITELGGTFFAVTYTRPPLVFAGFLAPIGGADASGGSFANPVKTFKAGSTIPVRFTALRDGTAIITGVHTLQATKYSSETTAETPIDATPQGKATTGNQFEPHGGQWHFNLDTKATGLSKGIWQLVATLSDGSQHRVWIQIK